MFITDECYKELIKQVDQMDYHIEEFFKCLGYNPFEDDDEYHMYMDLKESAIHAENIKEILKNLK